MGTLSSMAVYLYRKDKKYQCEVTIAIEKSTYLISLFILTRFLDHPPTQETSEDLSEGKWLVHVHSRGLGCSVFLC